MISMLARTAALALAAAAACSGEDVRVDLGSLSATLLDGSGRGDNKVVATLPFVDGSQRTFLLTPETDTMSPELRAAYPGIASFVGVELGSRAPMATTVTFSRALGLRAQFRRGKDIITLDPAGAGEDLELMTFKDGRRGGEFRCDAEDHVHAAAPAPALDASEMVAPEQLFNRGAQSCPNTYRVGDLQCDPMYNRAECGFDGGDCCSPWAECNAAADEVCECLDPEWNVVRHRKYRIAIGATTRYVSRLPGNSTDNEVVVASFVVVMARVNAYFKRELSMSFEIIGEVDQLIDRDQVLADYSSTASASWPNYLKARVPETKYDVGHLFGFYRNGVSYGLGIVCGSDKARGATGFDFDMPELVVAHELGHMYGAAHTWAYCNGRGSFPVEAGSGTSMMGYGGSCSNDNIDVDRDTFFHSGSIAQIRACMANPNKCGKCGTVVTDDAALSKPAVRVDLDQDDNGGQACANTTEQTKQPSPQTRQLTCLVPPSTPFRLAMRRDADSASRFFSWEQAQVGRPARIVAGQQPDTVLYSSAFPQRDAPVRTFPDMDRVRNGMDVLDWRERLPDLERDLEFVLVTRTSFLPEPSLNIRGAPGAEPEPEWDQLPVPELGATHISDKVTVRVVEGAPLRIANITGKIAPGGRLALAWTGGLQAATSLRALLSLDDGRTFPVLLAPSLDAAAGAAELTVPDALPGCGLGLARLRLESADALEGCSFFAVNDAALDIDGCAAGTPPPVVVPPEIPTPRPTTSPTPYPTQNPTVPFVPPPAVEVEVGPGRGRVDHLGREGAEAAADGYPDGQVSRITVRAEPGRGVVLRFVEFELNGWCCDYVTVSTGSGEQLWRGRYLGEDNYEFIGEQGEDLVVELEADEQRSGDGFLFEYWSIDVRKATVGERSGVFDHKARVGEDAVVLDGFGDDMLSEVVIESRGVLGSGGRDSLTVLRFESIATDAEVVSVATWDPRMINTLNPLAEIRSNGDTVQTVVPRLSSARNRDIFVRFMPRNSSASATGGYLARYFQAELGNTVDHDTFDARGRVGFFAAADGYAAGEASMHVVPGTKFMSTFVTFRDVDLAPGDLLMVRRSPDIEVFNSDAEGGADALPSNFTVRSPQLGDPLEVIFVAAGVEPRKGFVATHGQEEQAVSVGPEPGLVDHLGRENGNATLDALPLDFSASVVVRCVDDDAAVELTFTQFEKTPGMRVTVYEADGWAVGGVYRAGQKITGPVGEDLRIVIEDSDGSNGAQSGFVVEHRPAYTTSRPTWSPTARPTRPEPVDVQVGPDGGRVDHMGRRDENVTLGSYARGQQSTIRVLANPGAVQRVRFAEWSLSRFYGDRVVVRSGSRSLWSGDGRTRPSKDLYGELGQDVVVSFTADASEPGFGFVVEHEPVPKRVINLGSASGRFDQRGRLGDAAVRDGYDVSLLTAVLPSEPLAVQTVRFSELELPDEDGTSLVVRDADRPSDVLWSLEDSRLPGGKREVTSARGRGLLVEFSASSSGADGLGFVAQHEQRRLTKVGPGFGAFDHKGRVGRNVALDGYEAGALEEVIIDSNFNAVTILRFPRLQLAPCCDVITVEDLRGNVLADVRDVFTDSRVQTVVSDEDMLVRFEAGAEGSSATGGFMATHFEALSVSHSEPVFDHRGRRGDDAAADGYKPGDASVMRTKSERYQISFVRFTFVDIGEDDLLMVRRDDTGEVLFSTDTNGTIIPPGFEVRHPEEAKRLEVIFVASDSVSRKGFMAEQGTVYTGKVAGPEAGVFDHYGRQGEAAVNLTGFPDNYESGMLINARADEAVELRFRAIDYGTGYGSIRVFAADSNRLLETIYSDSEAKKVLGPIGASLLVRFSFSRSSTSGGIIVDHRPVKTPGVGPEPGVFDHRGRTGTAASADGYENRMRTETLVLPAAGRATRLRCSPFFTEMDFDFVEVYELSGRSSPRRIARWSGNLTAPDLVPEVVGSVGATLRVDFASDGSTTDAGFVCRHDTVAPEDAAGADRGPAGGLVSKQLTLWRAGDDDAGSEFDVAVQAAPGRTLEVLFEVVALPAGASVSVLDADAVVLHVLKPGDDVLPFPILSNSRTVRFKGVGLNASALADGLEGLVLARTTELRRVPSCEEAAALSNPDAVRDGDGNGKDDESVAGSGLALALAAGASAIVALAGAAFALRQRRRRQTSSVDLADHDGTSKAISAANPHFVADP